ncbi:phosphonate ABC transporter ATP-binding protein [Leptotrichia sp. OH3620_COT-345]|uniref:phosphonate ABC transporter ATP-binding protein n=1 Tax=Leptotrichia sp. OH3620_COT-345 TaxID=2491048 RepID=UPI000F65377D|nr:phosphonate ABC transporter ATP-binding protein [Leptotrichia sp. OH3620_COT-345]RRD39608.1 phosphonate ABC transporter ATP-binding protein [Leptotrichia sp. OH3620_COT-345]
MDNKNVLDIKKVTKKFNGGTVLENVNLSVDRGEIVALIGPSGAGKSTLMNLIVGILKPDEGEILIDKKRITEMNSKQSAKKVGMLRQQFDLVENINVVHNVLIGRFNEWGFFKSFISLFYPQDIEYAKAALRKMGIEDKIYESTSELSGGQKQRAAIARLLVQNPLLVLADEPVSSLDPANAENVLRLITELAKTENKTLIASMHSIEYSRQFFDRIIGMKAGKIVFDDKVENVDNGMINALYEGEINE